MVATVCRMVVASCGVILPARARSSSLPSSGAGAETQTSGNSSLQTGVPLTTLSEVRADDGSEKTSLTLWTEGLCADRLSPVTSLFLLPYSMATLLETASTVPPIQPTTAAESRAAMAELVSARGTSQRLTRDTPAMLSATPQRTEAPAVPAQAVGQLTHSRAGRLSFTQYLRPKKAGQVNRWAPPDRSLPFR